MEQMSEATVLDWLCLHVDPAHLPRRSAHNFVATGPDCFLDLSALAPCVPCAIPA